MWIVIGGGAVIVILVIAVVAVVLRNSGDDGQPSAQGGGNEEQEGNQSGGGNEEQEGGGDEEEEEEGGGQAQGEPPYELPEEPCDTLSDDAMETYSLDTPSKSLTDNRSSCSWSVDGEGDTYGTLRVEYNVPYAGADSVEGAEQEFQDAVDYATDEDDDYIERTVHEDEEADLGDEARLLFSTEKTTLSNDSVGTMLIRTENMNVEVRYAMMPGLGADEDAPAPLEFSDVEEMMHDLGGQAVSQFGA
ncbi:hypothetical protein F4561_003385 [Lipingzhangella halophila]|uniref:DUF3558 domain-containing protein n=1 Tax=Lipingzhangella halophila TaxID=1783352 RepID=A0A7W7W4B4_9ACTN|nr:DUF3558 domain-containing protein [Lipingzhangella halophila]MBB4932565.1 hypothetical protein [Lipingzhangella halophila]